MVFHMATLENECTSFVWKRKNMGRLIKENIQSQPHKVIASPAWFHVEDQRDILRQEAPRHGCTGKLRGTLQSGQWQQQTAAAGVFSCGLPGVLPMVLTWSLYADAKFHLLATFLLDYFMGSSGVTLLLQLPVIWNVSSENSTASLCVILLLGHSVLLLALNK